MYLRGRGGYLETLSTLSINSKESNINFKGGKTWRQLFIEACSLCFQPVWLILDTRANVLSGHHSSLDCARTVTSYDTGYNMEVAYRGSEQDSGDGQHGRHWQERHEASEERERVGHQQRLKTELYWGFIFTEPEVFVERQTWRRISFCNSFPLLIMLAHFYFTFLTKMLAISYILLL